MKGQSFGQDQCWSASYFVIVFFTRFINVIITLWIKRIKLLLYLGIDIMQAFLTHNAKFDQSMQTEMPKSSVSNLET